VFQILLVAVVAERKLGEIEVALFSLSSTPHKGSMRHEIYPNLRAITIVEKA